MSSSLSYVYAVARSTPDMSVQTLKGVGGAAVRLVGGSDLVGVVSDVDRAEFEAHALEERLSDLSWLESTARSHHHVVDAVGRDHVVAPLALATVFYDDERVREVIDQGREAFDGVLDVLSGRGEWGIKVYAAPGPRAARREGARSGAEYLRRRRDELRAVDQGTEIATTVAQEIHTAAYAAADDGRRHRLQDAALTGRSEPMVLNGAYLVQTRVADGFLAALAAWSDDPRVRMEITGPWVPYSFAQVTLP